jgi:N-acetylglucosaminyl-diphospho-decaprenol L-rhamnosyltransferase
MALMTTPQVAPAVKDDVSAVIVTYNSERVIADCLASLLRDDHLRPSRIIVVDNASRDQTVRIVKAVAPESTVFVNQTNRGLAAANNQGLRAATGPMILICNPDVEFQSGALAAMVDLMARTPRAAWVVPRLLYEDGRVQTSAGDLPTLTEAILGRQIARLRADSCSGFWWDRWEHDEERQIGRGHEAAYLVRRAAIDQVGMQDERYFLDWEGVDWTDRFRKSGWQIWIAPTAGVLHKGGDSIRRTPVPWVRSQHRAMYRYFADRRPGYWRPALAAVITVRALVKIAAMQAGLPLYSWGHRNRHDVRPAAGLSRGGAGAEPANSDRG